MDNIISDFSIIPKDNTVCGIPRLSCDGPVNSSTQSELNLAIATVPYQQYRAINDPECGLTSGTIFKELDLPFYGTGGVLL
ncbi:MAG: hypothetical protein K0S61_1711 [Anaerocolumna sp.]|jgi:hypothetical protein|nr:hypothetical protein [Anaerocolumna sp.]